MWLGWKGKYGSFDELQKIELVVTLDRDMLIDESEIIQNINASGEELSTRTKLEMHPYVDDVDEELKRLDEDKKKQQEDMELMQFQQDINKNKENEQKHNHQNDTEGKKTNKDI